MLPESDAITCEFMKQKMGNYTTVGWDAADAGLKEEVVYGQADLLKVSCGVLSAWTRFQLIPHFHSKKTKKVTFSLVIARKKSASGI